MNYTITIPARTLKTIKLSVNLNEGIGMVDYRNFGDKLEMLRGRVTIKDTFCINNNNTLERSPSNIKF